MEEIIVNNIDDIKISTQDNGEHILGLTMSNNRHASALQYFFLNNPLIIGYNYSKGNQYFYLSFEFPESQKRFDRTIYFNSDTLKWMDWIDEKSIKELWILYPDSNKKVIRYGESIPL